MQKPENTLLDLITKLLQTCLGFFGSFGVNLFFVVLLPRVWVMDDSASRLLRNAYGMAWLLLNMVPLVLLILKRPWVAVGTIFSYTLYGVLAIVGLV